MSKQAFDAFQAKLSEDASLRAEMAHALGQGGAKTTASVDEVVAFARGRGFDVDGDDVRRTVELTDEELDTVAGGAVDVFLKLSDIKGESKDSKHDGEIDLLSFSWGRR